MKIGDFAKKFNISTDTLRFYIKCSLLTPDKINNQYYFNKINEDQIKEILELKKTKFSIDEIQKIQSIKRMKTFYEIEENQLIKQIILKKKNNLLKEIEEIQDSLEILDKKLSLFNYDTKTTKKINIGIPITLINILKCPNCKNNLQLDTEKIEKNIVYEGLLNCECGYNIRINEGIIVLSGYTKKENDIYINIEKDYDKEVTPQISNIIEKSNNLMTRFLEKENTNNKIILEILFKQRSIISHIKSYIKDCKYYFLCAFNYNYLKKMKSFLEKEGIENVILFAGDYTTIPLETHQVDIVLDMIGNNSYYSYKRKSLSNFFGRITKYNGFLMTLFLHYDKSSKTIKNYPDNEKELYIYEKILEKLKDNRFDLIEKKLLGELDYSGNHITGVIEGDIIRFSLLLMKKNDENEK